MGRIKRRNRKRAGNLAAIAVLVGIASLALGLYIQHELDKYGILSVLAVKQRTWRDEAFQVALWSGAVFVTLMLISAAIRKL